MSSRDPYAGGYYQPGGGGSGDSDDNDEPDGAGGGVDLGGTSGSADPSETPGVNEDEEPNNAETVGSVTRNRGSAGAPGDTGAPTRSIGDDNGGDAGDNSSESDEPNNAETVGSVTRNRSDPTGGSDSDPTLEAANAQDSDSTRDRTITSPSYDPSEVGGLEDFSGDTDPRRSNQGLERIDSDSRDSGRRRQQLGEMAGQFEQEVLMSLPSGYDEGDIRITEKQQNGETVLAAEFTRAGEFERAEQLERRVIEQSLVQDESGVRILERDGGLEAEFTREGQEQILAKSLGVEQSDIAVEDGEAIGTSEEGRNALAMSQPRNRQKPTQADDDPSDRGGTSEFNTPNESITEERDAGSRAPNISGGDIRLAAEAEEQQTIGDLPESQQQAILNANPELDENTPVNQGVGNTEPADSVSEAYDSSRDLGEVLSDNPVQNLLGFGASIRGWQQNTTPVEDAGERARENFGASTALGATPLGAAVSAASSQDAGSPLSGVTGISLSPEETLAQEANKRIAGLTGMSPREARLTVRGAATEAVGTATQPFTDAAGEVTATSNEQASQSLEDRRGALTDSRAAALATAVALAEPTPFGEALLLGGGAALGIGGATASGTEQGENPVPASPFSNRNEIDVPEDGDAGQQSELEAGEQDVSEFGTPTEPIDRTGEVAAPTDGETAQNEIDVPEEDAPSPFELSFSTAVRQGRIEGRQRPGTLGGSTIEEPISPTIPGEITGPQIDDGTTTTPEEAASESSEPMNREDFTSPSQSTEDTIQEAEQLLEEAEQPSTQPTDTAVVGSSARPLAGGLSGPGAASGPGEATAPLTRGLGLGRGLGLSGGAALTDALAQPAAASATTAAATTQPYQYRFQQEFVESQPTQFEYPTFTFNARRPRRDNGTDDSERSAAGGDSAGSTAAAGVSSGISAGWFNEFVTGYAVGPGAREPASSDDSPAAAFLEARQTETQATATGETREAVDTAEATFSFENFGIDIGGGSDGLL